MIDINLRIEIGDILKRLRKVKGMSQDDLAEKLNLTRTSIVNIEKGRQGISVECIWRVAVLFKISPSNLFPKTDGSVNLLLEARIREIEDERDEWKSKYTKLQSILSQLGDHISPAKKSMVNVYDLSSVAAKTSNHLK
jgi:transcriptional regulator with XRE-family HTH domain